MTPTKNPTKNERILALLTAFLISGAAVLAFLIASGVINPVKLFGICGFEQRHNLPCPFCGMTRSVGMFVTGNINGSFRMQPAAAIMCIAVTFILVYSLARALGCQLNAIRNMAKRINFMVAAAAIILILLMGWAVSIYNY